MKNAIEFFDNFWTGIDIHSKKPTILTMDQLSNIVEHAMKYEREKVNEDSSDGKAALTVLPI